MLIFDCLATHDEVQLCLECFCRTSLDLADPFTLCSLRLCLSRSFLSEPAISVSCKDVSDLQGR